MFISNILYWCEDGGQDVCESALVLWKAIILQVYVACTYRWTYVFVCLYFYACKIFLLANRKTLREEFYAAFFKKVTVGDKRELNRLTPV